MQSTQTQTQPATTAAILKQYLLETFLYDRPDFVLTEDTPLIAQRILDSLQIFQLVSFLEERLGFSVEVEEMVLENFASIRAITALIHKRGTEETLGESTK